MGNNINGVLDLGNAKVRDIRKGLVISVKERLVYNGCEERNSKCVHISSSIDRLLLVAFCLWNVMKVVQFIFWRSINVQRRFYLASRLFGKNVVRDRFCALFASVCVVCVTAHIFIMNGREHYRQGGKSWLGIAEWKRTVSFE